MDTGMILFGREVDNGDYKIVKLIEPVYQIMYKIAQQHGSTAAKQAKVYNKLTEWVDEHYPGWGVQNFVDLSTKEANELNNKRINDTIVGPLELMHKPVTLFSWGMYVLLQRNAPHIQRRTTIENQIENNQTPLLGDGSAEDR